jgi:hypothetical protein
MNEKYSANPSHVSIRIQRTAPEIQYQHLYLNFRDLKDNKRYRFDECGIQHRLTGCEEHRLTEECLVVEMLRQ